MISLIHKYPVPDIKKSALQAIGRHLWYFAEHLIPLALFDDRVSITEKTEMIRNLGEQPNPNVARIIDVKSYDYCAPLATFVTSRSMKFFDLITTNQDEVSSLLLTPPAIWHDDDAYRSLQARVRQLKVVNDTAERGVSLIQRYNETLTKDEEQRQFLLQVVCHHRNQYPEPTKSGLQHKV